jgi:UDP-glucose 4-epimerase
MPQYNSGNFEPDPNEPMNPTILITGGAGYIGSHACVEFLDAGFDLVVVDSLVNSKHEALRRVEGICSRRVAFYQMDVRDRQGLQQVFREHPIAAVIHFAGLKAVGESVEKPLQYYDVNVAGSLALLEVMAEAGVRTLVFSSSATVYGNPRSVPIGENFPLSATNPYGRSKLMVEDMLRDLYRADGSWRIALLRYFNPVGAHHSGLIGEDPKGIPNNLMPIVARVATGKLDALSVYGNDYPTRDGTGVRDYIHVVDLAVGHLKALKALQLSGGMLTVNLGTGKGCSVLEVVRAFETASGRPVPYKFAPRRAGDVAECFADPALAAKLIGWQAVRGLDQMCADQWRWQSGNPEGYVSPQPA